MVFVIDPFSLSLWRTRAVRNASCWHDTGSLREIKMTPWGFHRCLSNIHIGNVFANAFEGKLFMSCPLSVSTSFEYSDWQNFPRNTNTSLRCHAPHMPAYYDDFFPCLTCILPCSDQKLPSLLGMESCELSVSLAWRGSPLLCDIHCIARCWHEAS